MTISEGHRERLREVVREAAAAEFLEKGYTAASIETIIRRAGGSKSKIYTYFGGKEGLFIEVVTESCPKTLQPLRDLTFESQDVATALESFGNAFLKAILAPEPIRLLRLVIAESGRFPTLGKTFSEAGPEQATDLLTRHLARFATDGSFRRDISPEMAATLFMDMISRRFQISLLVGALNGLQNEDVAATVKTAVRIITTPAG